MQLIILLTLKNMKHKISDCIQETNIQLIQQSMKVISDKVNETNQLVKEFIKEIKENYVTKIEHDVIKTQIKNQSSEIQKIDNKFWGATV